MTYPDSAETRRIFKNRWFVRFARQQKIEDADLCKAVSNAQRGVIDAILGGGVIKQRIARANEGKSGGFRSIILFRVSQHSFFVYGFAKNERDNIRDDELKAFKRAAEISLAFDDVELEKLLAAGELTEVQCNEENL